LLLRHFQVAMGDPPSHLPAPLNDSYQRWVAAADPNHTRNIQPKYTVEEHAVAQFSLPCESIDMDSDNTVDRDEFQMVFQKNDKLRALITEAKFNLKQADVARGSWAQHKFQSVGAA